MITVLQRQLPFLADDELCREVADRIHQYHLAYAHGLRRAGECAEARLAFRAALRERFDWEGVRGLAMATMKIVRGF